MTASAISVSLGVGAPKLEPQVKGVPDHLADFRATVAKDHGGPHEPM